CPASFALGSLVGRQRGRLLGDRRATLVRGVGRLLQLREFQLEVMATPLLRRHREALAMIGLLLCAELRLDVVASGSSGAGVTPRDRDRRFEHGELALPREHAVQLAVGREEADPLRGDHVALRRDEYLACGERAALAHRAVDVGAAAYACQPVREQASEAGARRLDFGEQRIALRGSRVLRRIGGVRRDPPGQRTAVGPRERSVEIPQLERIEPFAQHGFQRILPAALDIELLPQPSRALELTCCEPGIGVLVATDFRLQGGERFRTRLAVGQRATRLLPEIARRSLALLQRLDGVVQAGESRFPAGQIGSLLIELLGNERDLRGEGRTERSGFSLKPLASLRKRGQRLLRAFAARLGDAYRLLDVARLLLNLGQGLRLGGEIAFGLRERGLQRALFSRGGFAPGQCRGKLFLALASLGIDRRDLRV